MYWTKKKVGKGLKDIFGIDIKDTKWECAWEMIMNDADTTLSRVTESAVCAHENKCAATRPKKCILWTHTVASGELRLTGRENATDWKITIWMFDSLSKLLHRLLLIWRLTIYQLCCCNSFQFEKRLVWTHQDVEDHWKEEDEVGSSLFFVKYCSQCSFSHSRSSRMNEIEFVIQSLPDE